MAKGRRGAKVKTNRVKPGQRIDGRDVRWRGGPNRPSPNEFGESDASPAGPSNTPRRDPEPPVENFDAWFAWFSRHPDPKPPGPPGPPRAPSPHGPPATPSPRDPSGEGGGRGDRRVEGGGGANKTGEERQPPNQRAMEQWIAWFWKFLLLAVLFFAVVFGVVIWIKSQYEGKYARVIGVPEGGPLAIYFEVIASLSAFAKYTLVIWHGPTIPKKEVKEGLNRIVRLDGRLGGKILPIRLRLDEAMAQNNINSQTMLTDIAQLLIRTEEIHIEGRHGIILSWTDIATLAVAPIAEAIGRPIKTQEYKTLLSLIEVYEEMTLLIDDTLGYVNEFHRGLKDERDFLRALAQTISRETPETDHLIEYPYWRQVFEPYRVELGLHDAAKACWDLSKWIKHDMEMVDVMTDLLENVPKKLGRYTIRAEELWLPTNDTELRARLKEIGENAN